MNQTQALARLRKIIGPKLAYRVDNKALNAEQRAAQRAKFEALMPVAEAAEKARVARLEQLLRDDEQYQALKAQSRQAKEDLDAAKAGLYRKRITVGTDGGFFFSVKADGDNWAEVVSIIEGKTP